MRVFVTGATGFVTGAAVRLLLARGDAVVALVRDQARAPGGAEVVAGDLSDQEALRRGMRGADAVVHGAAMYEIGVVGDRRRVMFDANVRGTERVLSLARDLGIPRVVYISTIAVFGNTHGRVVDETYERTDTTYTSYYEETKLRAHEIAVRLADRGLPLVIAQPGQVYGPRDHSGFGQLLGAFARGWLPLVPFPDLGLNMTYVDDVAQGIVLALDRGKPGRAYCMGGEIVRARQVFDTLARVLRRTAPLGGVPYALLDAVALVRPAVREVVTSARGVTFWATDARARTELGYSPRSLEDGLREAYASLSAGSR